MSKLNKTEEGILNTASQGINAFIGYIHAEVKCGILSKDEAIDDILQQFEGFEETEILSVFNADEISEVEEWVREDVEAIIVELPESEIEYKRLDEEC